MGRPAKKLSVKEQQQIREQLSTDVQSFLAAGGKIEEIPMGCTGDRKNKSGKLYNLSKST